MKIKALTTETVIPVRDTASDTSEIVTQLLFGEGLFILEEGQKDWIRISCQHDGYEGWVDKKQVTVVSDADFSKFNDLKSFINSHTGSVVSSKRSLKVTLGSNLPVSGGETFSIGEEIFTFSGSIFYETRGILSTAEKYLGAPYLWGGRSVYGIDCSGFVQQVFKMAGKALPRDASQQATLGEKREYSHAMPGDLAFFANEKGKIIHVGIIGQNYTIIHAHGRVKWSVWDEKGILNDEKSAYTHKLAGIKCVI